MADVADPPHAPLTKRPIQIVVAIWLLSIPILNSLGISLYQIVTLFLYNDVWERDRYLNVLLPIIIVTVLGLSTWTLLTVKASAGRNWARIAMIACLLLSSASDISFAMQMPWLYSWSSLLSLWPQAFRVIALALMFFGPGKYWFSQNRA